MNSDPRRLLDANLGLLERAVAFVCRRHRLDPDDAEEFAAIVNLRLVDNDYAVLRAYEERSSFATFLSIVVQRMALDYRVHTWGKWHTSAEAKRLGALAVELERLLHRDGRSLDEALVILAPAHAGLTRDALAELAARLPERKPRVREVALGEFDVRADIPPADERLLADDRRRSGERLSALMSSLIAGMPEDDRLILQLRFEGGLAVSQIARALQLEQKPLYRKIERAMRALREELERAGVAPAEALDLIGRDEPVLDFALGNRNRRPSIAGHEAASQSSEESP